MNTVELDMAELETVELVRLDLLKKIIKCAIISPYIKGEKPISLMIIAKAESGKTTAMKVYRKNKGILYITDTTAWGIQREHINELTKGEIKTIMIPDLTTPLSRQTKTRKTFIAFLNNLIEEGVVRIEHYAMRWKEDLDVTCNVITAVTPEVLEDGRRGWAKMGFLSRFILFSYSYSLSDVQRILEEYSREDINTIKIKDEKIKLPAKNGTDIRLPKNMADKLNGLAHKIGTIQLLYGIRAKINLRSLIKAIAFLNGRKEVTVDDYKELLELADYMNLAYNIIK